MRSTFFKTAAFASLMMALPQAGIAQEREWQLDAQGEDAYLVFGVPNTADIGISLWCKLGQTSVSVFAPVPFNIKPDTTKMILKIESRDYALKPTFNTTDTTPTVEAELEPREEMLSALASAERITLVLGDHKSVFPMEGANFFEFNKLCTTAPVSN
jgi:hypothetical protein